MVEKREEGDERGEMDEREKDLGEVDQVQDNIKNHDHLVQKIGIDIETEWSDPHVCGRELLAHGG